MKDLSKTGDSTRVVHAGTEPDEQSGAVVTPISMATTFAQQSPGVHKGFEYSRTNNPTRLAWETQVAASEHGRFGVSFASGSAATTSIIHLLKSGDHVVAMRDCYGGTFRYFTRLAANFGVEFSFGDFTTAGAFEALLQPNSKLVWMETPTNPTLQIVDIAKVCEVAHKHGLVVVVDNTFATPLAQQPLRLGADMVVHSVTKYLNGHSDVVGGIVVTDSEEHYKALRFVQNSVGAVPGVMDCWLCQRGMKTLAVRMRTHSSNAMAVAKFLEGHEKIAGVIYPGLPSHKQHELAKRQMKMFGGIVSFYVKGTMTQTRQFMENMKLITLAESLGAVESLANHPAIMTHAAIPPEERAKLGITDNFIRLSVGIEDEADIIADLDQALSHVKGY